VIVRASAPDSAPWDRFRRSVSRAATSDCLGFNAQSREALASTYPLRESAHRQKSGARNNVFFDTCVYHQPGIDLLARVIPVDNILFASEMIGAVRGIDPETGHSYDDTKRYVEAAQIDPEQRHSIYEANARRVYPRLDSALKAKGR
jgi:hypothetical protein